MVAQRLQRCGGHVASAWVVVRICARARLGGGGRSSRSAVCMGVCMLMCVCVCVCMCAHVCVLLCMYVCACVRIVRHALSCYIMLHYVILWYV